MAKPAAPNRATIAPAAPKPAEPIAPPAPSSQDVSAARTAAVASADAAAAAAATATTDTSPPAEPTIEEFEAELAKAAEAVPTPAAAEPASTSAAEPATPPTVTVNERKARAILAAAARKEAESARRAEEIRAEALKTLRENPAKALADAGLTLEQLLAAVEGTPAEPKPDDRIAALEKRLADLTAADAARKDADEAARLTTQIHAEIKAAGKYPLIDRGGAYALVTELMVEHWQRHCVDAKGAPLPGAHALDRHVAAREVETYLGSLVTSAAPAGVAAAAKPAMRAPSPTLATLPGRAVAPQGEDLPLDEDARLAAVVREIDMLQ